MAESRTNGQENSVTGSAKTEDAVRSTQDSSPGDASVADSGGEVLAKGDTVGRYLVLERLGEGAMGVVYAAYDPELDRKIALKLLRPHSGTGDRERRQARLVREAKAIAKLSHPNVVGIFDVGVHEGQVFLAMEFLGGGTLRDWVAAKKRPWREVVAMFIEVGKGLAGAHAEGLIHRDFKPDNVLLDKAGKPKVVDFGLVRLAVAAIEASNTGSNEELDMDMALAETAIPTSAPIGGAALTKTGALAGTPAYMAPEQFLGKAIDERTDQFAFCVALYEALYGERPFAGETVIAIADAVTDGRVRATLKSTDVPGWVRACLLRGLRVGPAERHSGIGELLAVLANDPLARRRRRLLWAGAATAAVAAVLAMRHFVIAKRQEIEHQVTEHVRLADSFLAEATNRRRESRALRDRAFAAFDGFQRDEGEELWARALAASKAADSGYERGIQRLEAAATLTPSRDLKHRIADTLVDYIQMDGRAVGERTDALRKLSSYDQAGARAGRLNAPATLQIDTSPSGLQARLESYDPITHRNVPPANDVGRTPLNLRLAPGSYRLTFEDTPTHAGFHYPIVVGAGEDLHDSLVVPRRSAVPENFAYVPKGRFLFGSANEDIRDAFLGTVPLHAITTEAFLISKYETTLGEWIAFLETLPTAQQQTHRPHGRRDGQASSMDVQRLSNGAWQLLLRVTDRTYRARQGEPFQYQERTKRASQDWSRFPVAGITPEDALAYVAWLRRSGRVPGARLCSEHEWERAAKGADDRPYPHGARLASDEANSDVTYGRRSGAFGPDEVGTYSASRSPFGLFDIAGNVWEMTTSVLDEGQFAVRGGSFYQEHRSLVTQNRDPISSVTRDHTIGLRVCADAQKL
jgi:serine/threonine protein kinase/formylglycine-generating enzyme required for sulfatase activity